MTVESHTGEEFEASVIAWRDEGSAADMVVTIAAKEDEPFDVAVFAKLMATTVKLLKSVEKQQFPNDAKDAYYGLVEAAVVNDRASFTIRRYSRKAMAEYKAKKMAEKGGAA